MNRSTYKRSQVLRRDRALAVARLGADYHSGQRSRGYRALSKAHVILQKHGITHPLDYPQSKRQKSIYKKLSNVAAKKY